MNAISFLFDPANWSGHNGIGARLATHMWVSVTAVGAASIIAVPLGVALGHRRRGEVLAVAVANLSRAIPSLAILAFVVAIGGGIGFVPTWVAMFALALPPIFVGALTGVASIDRSITESATAMGMTATETLVRVEVPLATPLLISGLRVASGQVIATATLGAFVGYNTLGRFITVGRANRDDAMMFAGVILIVGAALLVDTALRYVERRSIRWRTSPETVSDARADVLAGR